MSETWEYAEADAPVGEQGFPWPPPEDGPILTAFGATWKGATFDPGAFFARTPREGGTGAAIVYYLAVGMLVAGAALFWDSMAFLGTPSETSLAADLGLRPLSPLVRFFLAPALLMVGLYVSAGVVHVLLLIFDGANHGFGTTVRVFSYAYSPAFFGVVPVLGPLVGSIWTVVLAIIGLREAHEAAAWKPAVAVLVPFVGAAILVFLMALTFFLTVGSALPGG